MKKVLSVIVPAYNVERYIEKCLDSFAQAKKRDMLEVIVVNDGSADGTERIAAEYCRKMPEVFRLITKENGGHGSAINSGMEQVQGKYFHVVDSDDWVNTSELDGFLDFLDGMDVDIVANDFMCIQDETFRVLDRRVCMKDPSLCRKKLRFDEVAERIPLIRIHSMTINTAFYRQHGIQIDAFRYYVDFEYTLFPVSYAQTIAFYDSFICMYRLGRNGQSVSIESMQKHRDNHMQVIQKLLDWYDAHPGMTGAKRAYMEMGISKIVENQFQIYISMGRQKGIRQEMKAFDQSLKERYPGVYQAVSKKSVWMLRYTDYRILPAAYLVYRLVKG